MEEKAIIISKNRKASFEFHFVEKFEAGILLTGTEIKSVREKDVNLSDAFCLFISGELWVRNLHIAPYVDGTHYNHEPKRDRKLLLHKKELRKLSGKMKDKGLTIIPTMVYISESGYAKISIVLAKGKKLYDKRESMKSKDAKREIDRNMK